MISVIAEGVCLLSSSTRFFCGFHSYFASGYASRTLKGSLHLTVAVTDLRIRVQRLAASLAGGTILEA